MVSFLEPIRINKFIASCGVCSRRNADEIILQSRVKINGRVVTDLATKVTSEDKVEVDNKEIMLEKNKIYIMLNKPVGYITTSKEQFNRPSVLDLVKVEERVFPVGRLDMDSEGLLILTNDGEFTNKITHPTKHIAKQYEVVLKEKITHKSIEKLESGVDIGGYITKPANVKRLKENVILITIKEGKNRQIRKMCEAIDNKVLSLKRVQIGKLKLGNLKIGEYKMLALEDIENIFK